MKKILAAAVVLLCLLGCSCSPQLPAAGPQQGGRKERPVVALAPANVTEDLGKTAYGHVANLVSFGPRDVGSVGWQRGLDYMAAELKRLGFEPRRDRWKDPVEGIEFENVSFVIPGNRRERIVLGCHHDTKRTHGHDEEAHNFEFVGANDSASGVGLLLALAPLLTARRNEATIEVVFFDGEESLDWDWNEAKRALFGSKRFVKEHRAAELRGEKGPIAAFVLLDMVGRTDIQVDEETNSTKELRDLLWSAAFACGVQDRFFHKAWPVSDDHLPFLEVGIPSLDIIDLHSNPHWHKPSDTLDNISADSLQMVGRVVLTALPAIEARYVAPRKAIR
ncbi:MAG: hypothetical protein RL148_916 [Planctomycetota bacterium]|jgi:hypothetical protein